MPYCSAAKRQKASSEADCTGRSAHTVVPSPRLMEVWFWIDSVMVLTVPWIDSEGKPRRVIKLAV